MSIEKTPQPFATFFIPLVFFAVTLIVIFFLVGAALYLFLPLAAAIMAGIAAFSFVFLLIHYAIYKSEWEATGALREIENKLQELINIAFGRGGEMYRPHLILTQENIPSFFTTLEELVGKSGKAGARIVSIQAMEALGDIFAFTNERIPFDNEVLTKEQFTLEMDLLDKLLDLLYRSFTLYHQYPTDFEKNHLDHSLEGNLYDLSRQLIVLINTRMLLFSIERDKPGEINQGEINHFRIPINKIIKLLFLIYPAAHDQAKIAIVNCLVSLPEKNLADHPSFGLYCSKKIPEDVKSKIVSEAEPEMKIAQQTISKGLEALKDADQIPNAQVNAVNNLLKKHPAERELSFGNEPFSGSPSQPTETNVSQEPKDTKNFSQSS